MRTGHDQYDLLSERNWLMIVWKEYALSIIVCVLFCGIVSSLVSGSGKKKVMDLICGAVLAAAVLRPVSGVKIQEFDFQNFISDYRNLAQNYVSMGELTAQEEQERYIKAACSEYISNRASAHGADVTAEIYLDEALVPVRAEITGYSAPELENELIRMLELDLGITKENQVWNWRQENRNS